MKAPTTIKLKIIANAKNIGVNDGLRSRTASFTGSNAKPLHYNHHLNWHPVQRIVLAALPFGEVVATLEHYRI